MSLIEKKIMLSKKKNVSRAEIFADFAVLGVVSENFSFELFRPPYILRVFANLQNFNFSNIAQP